MKNSHKVFISLGVIALVVLAAVLTAQNVKPGMKQFEKPLALTIIEDPEEVDAECPPEECGDASEDTSTDNNEDTVTGTTTDIIEQPVCKKDTWSCTTWSECSASGASTRSCTLKEDCPEVDTPKPGETDSCTPPCTEDQWLCTGWTTCSSAGASTRNCSLSFDCPTAETPKPNEDKSCTPPEVIKEPVVKEEPVIAVPTASESGSQKNPAADVSANNEATQQADNEMKAAEAVQEAAVQAAAVEIEAQAEEKIEEKIEEKKKVAEDVKNTIISVPAFNDLVKDLPPEALAVEPPAVQDINSNGIPDGVESAAGIDPNKVDEGMVQFQAKLAVETEKLLAEGKSKAEVKAIVEEKVKTKKAENKVEMVRNVAKEKYGVKIEKPSQDTNGDGVSDETEIVFGLNPKEKKVKGAEFSPAEKKIYGLSAAVGGGGGGAARTASVANTKCTMSVKNGNKLSSKGFTVLAACPKNQTFSLYAIDTKGRQTLVDTKKSSGNRKMVFAVAKKFKSGKYMLQIRPSTHKTALNGNYLLTSAMDAGSAAPAEQAPTLESSNPALIEIVDDKGIPEPTIQTIEGVDIAGLRDIKVTSTKDGKIRVTGLTDISTMVVGTFQSAVFTSAILADVKTGSFEVTSSEQLEAGDHEVVIYASRPEESSQSMPVTVRFSIIQTANAASGDMKNAAADKQFPVGATAAVGGAILLIAVATVILRKKKKSIV